MSNIALDGNMVLEISFWKSEGKINGVIFS